MQALFVQIQVGARPYVMFIVTFSVPALSWQQRGRIALPFLSLWVDFMGYGFFLVLDFFSISPTLFLQQLLLFMLSGNKQFQAGFSFVVPFKRGIVSLERIKEQVLQLSQN